LPANGVKRAGCACGLVPAKWTRRRIASAWKCAISRMHRLAIDALPDGAFVALEEAAFVTRGDALLRWTPHGYDARRARPRRITVDVLTPPAILAVLSAGYEPRWHPTAGH